MVFGARLSEALEAGRRGPAATGAMRTVFGRDGGIPGTPLVVDHVEVDLAAAVSDVAAARRGLQHAMTRGAGVVRSSASLASVRGALGVAKATAGDGADTDRAELANLVTCAEALLSAATARTESRGCHVRAEFPDVDVAWRRRLVVNPAR
jgi:L-aspartate oxidase